MVNALYYLKNEFNELGLNDACKFYNMDAFLVCKTYGKIINYIFSNP